MLVKCSLTLSGTTRSQSIFHDVDESNQLLRVQPRYKCRLPSSDVPDRYTPCRYVAPLDRPGDLESVQMEFDSGVSSGRTRATACFLLCEDEEADLLDVTNSSFQLSAV
jgi:hypothetical protein